VISGKIVDASAASIAGAQVTLYRLESRNGRWVASTSRVRLLRPMGLERTERQFGTGRTGLDSGPGGGGFSHITALLLAHSQKVGSLVRPWVQVKNFGQIAGGSRESARGH
jgi:hypothetical protein